MYNPDKKPKVDTFNESKRRFPLNALFGFLEYNDRVNITLIR